MEVSESVQYNGRMHEMTELKNAFKVKNCQFCTKIIFSCKQIDKNYFHSIIRDMKKNIAI